MVLKIIGIRILRIGIHFIGIRIPGIEIDLPGNGMFPAESKSFGTQSLESKYISVESTTLDSEHLYSGVGINGIRIGLLGIDIPLVDSEYNFLEYNEYRIQMILESEYNPWPCLRDMLFRNIGIGTVGWLTHRPSPPTALYDPPGSCDR